MIKKLLYLSAIIAAACFSSCEKSCGCGPRSNSISGYLPGKWQWIKTTTPSKTILAKDAGYAKTMEYSYDQKIGAYKIDFYKNDSLETNFLISKVLDDNWETKSMLLKYNGDAQLKIFGLPTDSIYNDINLITSEITPKYSSEADTIRHFYQRIHSW
ncbi:hypothetical protein ACFP1I_20880 [Dyadobacter subterraneus]|uniref:Lipocalin-like domain-containing protein n=1 Tax=Dyadobacter subterraneus TaxID=2773304 RepID=A0ABR9W755_9BACT|nr:hypothetical protein [Dyadobacter subterraneus]MBE9461288.1 hypothetical protein [Dyadobacter subterraneus]